MSNTLNNGDWTPAQTWALPAVLTEGQTFTARKDTARPGQGQYWVNDGLRTIPARCIGLVRYGDPSNVGLVRIIWADTQKARRAMRAQCEY
jgi:hypothetical protein